MHDIEFSLGLMRFGAFIIGAPIFFISFIWIIFSKKLKPARLYFGLVGSFISIILVILFSQFVGFDCFRHVLCVDIDYTLEIFSYYLVVGVFQPWCLFVSLLHFITMGKFHDGKVQPTRKENFLVLFPMLAYMFQLAITSVS